MNQIIRKYQKAQTSHSHDNFHQIILPLCGVLNMEVDGHQGDVAARTLGIVTMGENHAFYAEDNNRFLVLDIPAETAKQYKEETWMRAIERPFHTMSEALLSLTDYAAFHTEKAPTSDWFETWQTLFLKTLECDLVNDLPALPARIHKAIQYMQANLARPLSNKDLAQETCLSPARFYDVFRQATGISPQAYLTQCRLKEAKRLIIHGNSLSEAALDVGFSDQSSFGRAFQKAYGLSPGQWRKQELETKK